MAPVVAGVARGGSERVGLGDRCGLPVLEAAAEAGAQGAVGEGLDHGEGDGGEHQHARQLLPRRPYRGGTPAPPPPGDGAGRRCGTEEEERRQRRHRAGRWDPLASEEEAARAEPSRSRRLEPEGGAGAEHGRDAATCPEDDHELLGPCLPTARAPAIGFVLFLA
jgi:hypothetical protein